MCNGGNTDNDIKIQNFDNSPYTYSLNDQIFDEGNVISNDQFSISNLVVGTYTIYIKDNEECIDTIGTVALSEPEALSLSTSVQDVICNGESSGTLAFNIEGGTPNYQVALNDVNNIVSIDAVDTLNLVSGTYQLIAKDDNNCMISEEALLINQSYYKLTHQKYLITTALI